jgi:uncharacterized protein
MLFTWGDDKEEKNIRKDGLSFDDAKNVFLDARRVIMKDIKHSQTEPRFFCFGVIKDPKTNEKRVCTVRFTVRDGVIRIYGAGFWRKGRKIYETKNETRSD